VMLLGAVTLPLVLTVVITVPVCTVAVRVTAFGLAAAGAPTDAYASPPPLSATAMSTAFAAVHLVTRMS
jgi:hypothetical protein